MNRRMLGASLAVALLCGVAFAGDALKSGPQVGAPFPGAFHPLNVTNCYKPSAVGQKNCFV
jgi:hypothetical protein